MRHKENGQVRILRKEAARTRSIVVLIRLNLCYLASRRTRRFYTTFFHRAQKLAPSSGYVLLRSSAIRLHFRGRLAVDKPPMWP